MDGKSIISGEKASQHRKRRSRLTKDKFKKRKRTRSSSSDSSSQEKKPHKKKKGGAKRKRKSSTSDDSSSSSSSVSSSSSFTSFSSSEEERKRKKIKRKKKRKHAKSSNKSKTATVEADEGNLDIPLDFMDKARNMAPMTKEEWEIKQSVVRRVYDESTGRHRLIKGDGEVVEEIVSRDRHKAINQQATKGDGEFFQACVNSSVKK